MADAEAEPRTPRALRPIALHAAAVVGPLTILLFRRPDVAEHLDLLGAIVGETVLAAVVAVAVAALTVRTRNALPAGSLLFMGAVGAAVGVALMAWTIELGLFVAGMLLYVVGSASALVLHRPLLSSVASPATRYRTMSWYWAAASFGAGWPLGLRILTDVSFGTVLWINFAFLLLTAALLAPQALLHDDDVETEQTIAVLDAPWPRRSYWAAFGVGMVVLAGAQPALRTLVDEWQRSPRQTAAVLGVGVLASAAINAFGPWYHRLDRLAGSRRSDAIGLQLLVAGAAVFIGGLSSTYIGLIVSWAIAGGAIGLAATSLDAAVFPTVSPELRRTVAFRQIAHLAAGAAVGLFAVHVVFDSLDEQWQFAILGLPLVWIGWAVRRFADSARDADVTSATAASAQVPRRVAGLDGSQAAVLDIKDLQVSYGSVQVLFDVDLTIQPGQVVALLGTNGAGKTTLLRTISGLEPVGSGSVVYSGLDITKTRPTWRVGMGLHQIVGGEAVVGPLTVDENLRLFSHDVGARDGVDPLAEVFQVFPILEERRFQRAETLSGGEKQMLALSKALIVKPRLLLIDEFSLGLAPIVVGELLPVVRTIVERGSAVLLVEQSVNIALAIADYAYVMEKGEIGYHGPADELRAQPELVRSAYLEGLSQALKG
ncbi:MAG: ATP-binding cassette domain-containing protein [Acidimicrobiales bacterium]